MNTKWPEHGFEDLLTSLQRDLLDAADEEIYAIASELGIKPGMKGSIALFGVTVAVRFKTKSSRRQSRSESAATRPRSRRGPKGDAPSST